MPFWKKAYQKKQGVYYPQAIVQGKPVETETIAKDLSKISTVSNSDVQAVLGDIAGVSKCMPSFFYDKASTFPSRGFVLS